MVKNDELLQELNNKLSNIEIELKILQNQNDGMNKYYAQALTKTLITKEELEDLKKLMMEIKAPEVKKAVRKMAVKKGMTTVPIKVTTAKKRKK